MARRTKNIIAVTPGGDITEDMVMGYLTMFTIPDRAVSSAKLNRTWIAEGLPHEFIPKVRRNVNTFQRACRSVETRRRDESANTTEIVVDPVSETVDKAVYQVTRLVRDKANEIIDHPKALKVVFDKHTEVINWQRLDQSFPKGQADAIGQAINDWYDDNTKRIPAPRVREAVRKLMDHLSGTNLRKKAGGVYMVPRKPMVGTQETDSSTYLDSLEAVFDALWDGHAELIRIPLVSSEENRNMVERHFNLEISSEVDEMMALVHDGLSRSDRSMRKDAVGNFLARRKVLGDRHAQYKEIVGGELELVGDKFDLLDQQLEALVLAKGGED